MVTTRWSHSLPNTMDISRWIAAQPAADGGQNSAAARPSTVRVTMRNANAKLGLGIGTSPQNINILFLTTINASPMSSLSFSLL